MARTVQQIYDLIIQEKESLSSLDGLAPEPETYTALLAAFSTSSKVGIWRLWAYVTAVVTAVLENLWDIFKSEVTALVNAAKPGTLGWYVEIARLFQLGDPLILVGNYPAYATINALNQIIAQASANEDGGTVFVKVAKMGAMELEPLTAGELTQFTAYMNQRKFAGVSLNVSSLNADQLQVVITIKYDPILDQSVVLSNVEAAINTYLQALPFDGVFRRLGFEDALQAVEGVIGVELTTLTGVQGLNTTVFTQTYLAQAGYMNYDQTNSTITMTAI